MATKRKNSVPKSRKKQVLPKMVIAGETFVTFLDKGLSKVNAIKVKRHLYASIPAKAKIIDAGAFLRSLDESQVKRLIKPFCSKQKKTTDERALYLQKLGLQAEKAGMVLKTKKARAVAKKKK